MKSKNVLIVGCGDLGARAGATLLSQGFTVTGLRRDCSRLPPAFTGLAADYTGDEPLAALEDLAPDYIILTLKPAGTGAAAYRRGFGQALRNVLTGLGAHRPAGIVMVSSTRVYAECDGDWVEEDSALNLTDPAALAIIAAEQMLQAAAHPTCLLRCAGIYGDPEGGLLRRVASGKLSASAPVRYGNRIHRDDVAGLLVHLLLQWAGGGRPEQVVIGVDDNPAPQFEVESWLARQLGTGGDDGDGEWARGEEGPPPSPAPDGSALPAHKRCRNAALRRSGYTLRYPDYRSGYTAVLAARRTVLSPTAS